MITSSSELELQESVPSILERYRGREVELLQYLQSKYDLVQCREGNIVTENAGKQYFTKDMANIYVCV